MDEEISSRITFLSIVLASLIAICFGVLFQHKDKETFVKNGYEQQEYCSEVSTKWVKK